MRRKLVGAIIVMGSLVCSLAVVEISTQHTLNRARALYAAAEYEKALEILNAASAGQHPPAVGRDLDVYRFECLIALDRGEEAARIVEAILVADPGFRTADADMPLKPAEVFREMRQRILPRVALDQYTKAKSLLDQKRYDAAAAKFRVVLALLDDTDFVHQERDKGPVSMRRLAHEYRDLSTALAAR